MGNYKDRPLIGYIPTVLKEVREYQALTVVEQPEIWKLFNEIQIALDNQFVHSSTEYGVKRWEKILDIKPKATDTLEQRKNEILIHLNVRLPFTYRWLIQFLTLICGEDGFLVNLEHNRYFIEFRFLNSEIILISTNKIISLLKAIIPANLGMSIEVNSSIDSVVFVGALTSSYVKTEIEFDLDAAKSTVVKICIGSFVTASSESYIHFNINY